MERETLMKGVNLTLHIIHRYIDRVKPFVVPQNCTHIMEAEGQRSPLKKYDLSYPGHIADPCDCEHLYALIEEL